VSFRRLISSLRAQVESSPLSFYAPVSARAAQPLPGLPFFSPTARKVWEKARDLAFSFPDDSLDQVLRRAAEEADTDHLPAEDHHILRIALRWLRSSEPA